MTETESLFGDPGFDGPATPHDQHMTLRFGSETEIAVGDVVTCGVSHPCTAFDKWRVIPVVDDDYRIVDLLHTYF